MFIHFCSFVNRVLSFESYSFEVNSVTLAKKTGHLAVGSPSVDRFLFETREVPTNKPLTLVKNSEFVLYTFFSCNFR